MKEVVERLSGLVVEEGKEESRDVYVIGMKTIIAHMSSGGAVGITGTAAAGGGGGGGGEVGGKCLLILISGLQRPSASSSVLLAALDIAHQLLLHFASSLPLVHSTTTSGCSHSACSHTPTQPYPSEP